MTKLQRNSEQVQHFFEELKDQFWGDANQFAKNALKTFLDGCRSENEINSLD